MYKTFRQAVGMLKQNPFISVISILGTALAIMMIMTMIVTFQIKNASVAPEAFSRPHAVPRLLCGTRYQRRKQELSELRRPSLRRPEKLHRPRDENSGEFGRRNSQ